MFKLKIKIIIFTILFFVVGSLSVYAQCDSETKPKPVDKKTTLQQTFGFIGKYVNCLKISSSDQHDLPESGYWTISNISGCTVTFSATTFYEETIKRRKISYSSNSVGNKLLINNVTMSFSDLNPENINSQETGNSKWNIQIFTTDKKNLIKWTRERMIPIEKKDGVFGRSTMPSIEKKEKKVEIDYFAQDFNVVANSINLGKRIENALRHGIKLCGGKTDSPSNDPF